MIPKNIKKNHVLNAIQKIDKDGVPNGRHSTKFKLVYEGKLYPPKYLISLANYSANGEELESSGFSGGRETNKFLE